MCLDLNIIISERSYNIGTLAIPSIVVALILLTGAWVAVNVVGAVEFCFLSLKKLAL